MNIPKLEQAVNAAVDALNRNDASSYELTVNLEKLQNDIHDKEAFEYLERLCNSPRGLQDLWLEDMKYEDWLDLIDSINSALTS